VNGATSSSATMTMTANTWYHLYISLASNGDAKIYVNNVLLNTTTINAPNNNIVINTNSIGNNSTALGTGVGFPGYIDDFRIYNKIISDTERGLVYTQNYPTEPTYLNMNSYYQIQASGLPFINRGNGKSTLAITQMISTTNNMISSNEIIFQKPNETGNLNLDLINISTNAVGDKLLSDSVFIFQIEGID
jgi:hypothetical protein